jgi:NADPH:quinone reductase-like Zn-dependent oxidoreductase
MATTSLPTTMRALLQPDKASTKLILTTRPIPTPKPDEHLIRVHTTALTNGELFWAKNFASIPVAEDKEPVPGYDMAGTIITAPAGSQFHPGDEVYARTDYFRTGTAREYTVVPAKELALRPKRFTWAESATVPMSASTAWQALFVQAGLKPEAGTGAKGKRIFVTAASGGVGTWVVQLAKWAGAEVVATCGSQNVKRVKEIGASEVIDYKTTDIKAWATSGESRKADLAIDCIGHKSLEDAWWVVKEGGTLISIVQPPEQVKPIDLDGKDIKNFFFVMEANGKQLAEVTKLIEGGGYVTGLDSVFPLERFEEALAKLESGKTSGKIVLDMGVAN